VRQIEAVFNAVIRISFAYLSCSSCSGYTALPSRILQPQGGANLAGCWKISRLKQLCLAIAISKFAHRT